MYVNNDAHRKTFGILKVNNAELIKKTPKNIQTSVNNLVPELAKTKHWDLAIHIDELGKTSCEYIYKKDLGHTYCDGIKNAQRENNHVNGMLLWVKNISDEYKEHYISSIDLIFKTVEQAKEALKIFNSQPKSLEYEANIVKTLDSAEEIIFDDTARIVQNK